MRRRVVVHLNSGDVVAGDWNDVTEEQAEMLQSMLGELLGGSGGWQINIEAGNNWYIFPGSSVKYVQIQGSEAE